jgi:hypothetical protein
LHTPAFTDSNKAVIMIFEIGKNKTMTTAKTTTTTTTAAATTTATTTTTTTTVKQC